MNDDSCGFVCWADKPSGEQIPPSPSNVSPQQSQQSGSYAPATPRKRPFNATFPLSPVESGPSQKRKRVMEEALAEQSTPTRSDSQARSAYPTPHREKGPDDQEALWTRSTPQSSSQKLKVSHSSQSYGTEENPFISQSPPNSQRSAASSTTLGESSGDEMEPSPDSISTLLAGIPEYLRKLERKKIAAEKSSQAKAKRIAELETEVEKLKEKNNYLKATIRELASGD